MKKMTCFKRVLLIILSVLLAAVPVILSGCSEELESSVIDQTNAIEIGEGIRSFYFVVTDLESGSKVYHVHTNCDVVGYALLELELISGDESQGSLYVKTVDGITCDWTVDSTWWCFYVKGQMSTVGVNEVVIEEDANYEFKVTKS